MKETIKVRLYSWNDKSLRHNDDGRSWGVYAFELPDGSITPGVGVLDDSHRREGMPLQLEGRYTTHPKFGIQFGFSSAVPIVPATLEGVEFFLQTAPGIGPATAKKLIHEFGTEAAEVLAHSPQRVEDTGILRREKLQAASENIADRLNEMAVVIPLTQLLQGLGVPKALPAKLAQRVRGDAVTWIKTDPFRLLQYRGVGWLKADQLRKQLGLPGNLPSRLRHGVVYAMEQLHPAVWVESVKLLAEVRRLLGRNDGEAQALVQGLVDRDLLRFDATSGRYALAQLADQEEAAACEIHRVAIRGDWPTWDEGRLTDHQNDQVKRALANGNLAVLLGSAGCGKSYCAAQIIRACLAEGDRVVVCAPTGKAAVRIDQLLAEEYDIRVGATTIHRLLGARPRPSGGFEFAVDGVDASIDADLVVVDEASMLDNALAAALFRAIRAGTRVLLVGDPFQLPPVGAGTVLRDLQTYLERTPGRSCGLLTQVHRSQGLIPVMCGRIRNGEFPLRHTRSPGVTWDRESNFQYAMAGSSEAVANRVVGLAGLIRDRRLARPDGTPFTPGDMQVITATNSSTVAGKDELNQRLQKLLNPAGGGKHAYYRDGDRVMCTKNCWAKPERGARKYFLANGGMGYVAKAEAKRIFVDMDDLPGQTLVIPTGPSRGDFDLAYAITVHKSQGSQWPLVIVAADPSFAAQRICDRAWLYTSVSRAQELCLLLGSQKDLTRAAGSQALNRRYSRTTAILEGLDND